MEPFATNRQQHQQLQLSAQQRASGVAAVGAVSVAPQSPCGGARREALQLWQQKLPMHPRLTASQQQQQRVLQETGAVKAADSVAHAPQGKENEIVAGDRGTPTAASADAPDVWEVLWCYDGWHLPADK
jgi:hypothetical protein